VTSRYFIRELASLPSFLPSISILLFSSTLYTIPITQVNLKGSTENTQELDASVVFATYSPDLGALFLKHTHFKPKRALYAFCRFGKSISC
jgi:hypothetical protein